MDSTRSPSNDDDCPPPYTQDPSEPSTVSGSRSAAPVPADELPPLHVRTPTGPVPLAYVRDAERVWLVAQVGSSRWAVEILRAGQVTLDFPKGSREGTCRLLADPDGRAAVLRRFSEKYGSSQIDRWFHPPGRVVEISLTAVGELAYSTPSAYFAWLEAEFDSIAADYDRHILGNRINRLLRDRSLVFLRQSFQGRRRLLEIGCGSGTETVELLADGHEILAADISAKMLETVRAKARVRGLSERLTVVKVRAGQIRTLVASEGTGNFEGVYSTYGALNCEPDLAPLPPALRELLAANGRFVAGVFNRWCGFETVVYSLLLRHRRAWGRHANPVAAEASRFCVDAFAYSVPEFTRAFSAQFRTVRTEGVPVLLPPSDLARYVEMFAPGLPRLARWDAAVGRHFPFSWLGDHFLIEMAPRVT
jgi:SAM-dependent methyltransferase